MDQRLTAIVLPYMQTALNDSREKGRGREERERESFGEGVLVVKRQGRGGGEVE